MNNKIKHWQGYLFLLLAQLMVGICIVGSKSLLQTTPAVIILTIRFTIGTIFLLLTHMALGKGKFSSLGKLSRQDWGFIIIQALCAGFLFNVLLLFGMKYTSASVAGIITSALPAVIVILSIIFLKEKITIYTTLCVLFAVIGLMIINLHNFHFGDHQQIYGDIIILIALLPDATYYVVSKLHKNKLPVFLVSALMNGINVPLFLLCLLFFHHNVFIQNISSQYLLLLIVGIASALFYVFWFLGCKQIHGSSAGLTTAFMPIATLVVAYLFLNEKITLIQMLGMILVILSIFFNAIKQNSNKHLIE